MTAPTKLCPECGGPILEEDLLPDKGPQIHDECWFRRADVKRILSESAIETLRRRPDGKKKR